MTRRIHLLLLAIFATAFRSEHSAADVVDTTIANSVDSGFAAVAASEWVDVMVHYRGGDTLWLRTPSKRSQFVRDADSGDVITS